MPSLRSLTIATLLLLGACAGGPREGDRPPSFLPPPRLEDAEIEKVGRDAGAALGTMTAVLQGPVCFARVANMIGYRELKGIDARQLRAGFEAGSQLETVSGTGSFSLVVDALVFVHRAAEGAVKVEYSFDFLLLDRIGGNLWTRCLTRTAEGGRGELVPQSLKLHDLDLLAAQGATSVRDGLAIVGTMAVHLVPHEREGLASSIVVAFEDRVRQALLERGVKLEGNAGYIVEVDAGPLDHLARTPPWEQRPDAKQVTGAEYYEFVVNLSSADAMVPFKPWRQIKTTSGSP